MTADSIKTFKLAVAVVLSFGLGMARVLPVQAAAIAKSTHSSQSHSQLLDSYQLKLDDLTLPSTVKIQTRVAQTASAPLGWDAEAPAPQVAQAPQDNPEKGQGAIFSEGLFSLAFFATIVYIIYNLISRGRSVAAVSSPGPTAGRASPDAVAIAAPETISPPALGETEFDAPTAIPTPALLPGLLGLSLKLFRQKKAESQAAAL